MHYLIDQLNAMISQLEAGKGDKDTVARISSLLRDITHRSDLPDGCLGKLSQALVRLGDYCKSHGTTSLAYEMIRVVEFINKPRLNVGKTAAKGEAKMRQEAQSRHAAYSIMSKFGFNVYAHLYK